MIKIFYFSTFFIFFYIQSKCQSIKCSTKIVATIQSVDTIYLLKNSAVKDNNSTNHLKVLKVNLKINKENINSKIKKVAPYLIIDIEKNENNCNYEFILKSTYILCVNTFKYNSILIKNELRKKMFKLDCNNMPILLSHTSAGTNLMAQVKP